MTACPGCLKEGHDTYCAKCRKRLFGGKKVSHVLSFSRPFYNQTKLSAAAAKRSKAASPAVSWPFLARSPRSSANSLAPALVAPAAANALFMNQRRLAFKPLAVNFIIITSLRNISNACGCRICAHIRSERKLSCYLRRDLDLRLGGQRPLDAERDFRSVKVL